MMMIRQEAEVYKLFLYDEIRAKEWTWDGAVDAETSARKVQETLEDIPDGASIELHVNSNGGDAYQGVAIYNAMKQKDAHITAYLDKMMESNRKIYLSKCNLTEDELIELMEREEFLTPEEAVEMGFADEIAEDSEEDPDDNKDGAGEEDQKDGEKPEDPEDGKEPEEPEAPDDEDDPEKKDDEEEPEESVRISASQCAEFLGTFF